MDSEINLEKYRDYLKKTDSKLNTNYSLSLELLDDCIPCDSTNFEGNWISNSAERSS